MRQGRGPATIIAAMCSCAIASASLAGEPANRDGLYLGVGFGGGVATWEWADPGQESPSEASGTIGFRLGGAIRNNLVLGAEFQGWRKTTSEELGETAIFLGSLTCAVTWFPGNIGIYLRGGIGAASAKWKTPQVSTGGTETDEATDLGVGFLGAAGYEWRVSQKFAMAPQVQIAWYAIDGDFIKDPFVADVSIQFNWYW